MERNHAIPSEHGLSFEVHAHPDGVFPPGAGILAWRTVCYPIPSRRGGAFVTSGPICVLLVDDVDSVRETVADLLETEQYRVLQAVDAAQALMILREEQTTVDILVTDLSMPGADGVTLITQARKMVSDLPAILLTGYAEQVSSVAMAAGGFHVLRKPVSGDQLFGLINTLLGRSDSPGGK